jgi:hypothetical protein
MREYRIAHFPKENERSIFRQSGDRIQRLSSQKVWTKEKQRAKRYLHEQDCVSALITTKMQWELKTEEEYIEEKLNEWKEKQTRGEL